MTLDERHAIYKQAIAKYGAITQIIVAIEEMAELAKELTKYLRDDIENIDEELADVEIMIEQLVYMFNAREKIDKIKNHKIKRLEGRLIL